MLIESRPAVYPANWRQGTPSYSEVIIGLYTLGIATVAGVVIMVPVVTGERSYFSETTGGHEHEHPDIVIGKADRGGLFTLFKRGTDWTWRFIDQGAVAASTTTYLSRLEAKGRVEAVKEQVANAGLLGILTTTDLRELPGYCNEFLFSRRIGSRSENSNLFVANTLRTGDGMAV